MRAWGADETEWCNTPVPHWVKILDWIGGVAPAQANFGTCVDPMDEQNVMNKFRPAKTKTRQDVLQLELEQ